MSTRANIIIEKPSWNERLIFYRHSDGYPEGVKETLDKFVEHKYNSFIKALKLDGGRPINMLYVDRIPEGDEKTKTEHKLDLALSIIHDFMYTDIIPDFPNTQTAEKYGMLTGEYMILTPDGVMKPDSKEERKEIIKDYGIKNITEINKPLYK